MSAWHVNEGLAPLIAALKAEHPGIVIGTIGDAAHRAEKSDHNPNAAGRVNAADLMLGDAFPETQALELQPFLIADKRTHYVIHDERIWTSETGAWRHYDGSDPHTNHIHLSVHDSAHTNTSPWEIPMALTAEDKKWITAQITTIVEKVAERVWATKIGNTVYPARDALHALNDVSTLRDAIADRNAAKKILATLAGTPLAEAIDLLPNRPAVVVHQPNG
jgi:hypothetical protein